VLLGYVRAVYVYDDADRLITVTGAANTVTTYGYDTENNLTSIQDVNHNTTHFSYDAIYELPHSKMCGCGEQNL
jgi:YD repeat-containing protein